MPTSESGIVHYGSAAAIMDFYVESYLDALRREMERLKTATTGIRVPAARAALADDEKEEA